MGNSAAVFAGLGLIFCHFALIGGLFYTIDTFYCTTVFHSPFQNFSFPILEFLLFCYTCLWDLQWTQVSRMKNIFSSGNFFSQRRKLVNRAGR